MPDSDPGLSPDQLNWSLTERLVDALDAQAIVASPFAFMEMTKRHGIQKLPRPELLIIRDKVHIVCTRLGEQRERECLLWAAECKESIVPLLKLEKKELGEVFAVTFGADKGEKCRLHVLARKGREKNSFVLENFDKVAAQIALTLRGPIAESYWK